MEDGHDKNPIGPSRVDDPAALADQLAHIVAAFNLGYLTPDLVKVRQLLDGGDDALRKAPRVIG
jgi:hypothetical protein